MSHRSQEGTADQNHTGPLTRMATVRETESHKCCWGRGPGTNTPSWDMRWHNLGATWNSWPHDSAIPLCTDRMLYIHPKSTCSTTAATVLHWVWQAGLAPSPLSGLSFFNNKAPVWSKEVAESAKRQTFQPEISHDCYGNLASER